MLATSWTGPGGSVAQIPGQETYQQELFLDIRQKRKGPPPPRLMLRVAMEIPLPGPLRTGPLDFEEGRLRVGVPGGRLILEPGEDASPVLEPTVAIEDPPRGRQWEVGGRKGKRRFRTEDGGLLRAQKRSASRPTGWRNLWKVRIPGETLSRPVVIGKRVFVGSTDSRIYALRLRNGHRIWARDYGDRLILPISHWIGEIDGQTFDLLLAVPAGKRSLLVIDPFDGTVVASYSLPGDGEKFVSSAVPVDQGRIAIARQKYLQTEAGLLVLDLVTAEEFAGSAGDVPYNGEAPEKNSR